MAVNHVNTPRGAVQALNFDWSVSLLLWAPSTQATSGLTDSELRATPLDVTLSNPVTQYAEGADPVPRVGIVVMAGSEAGGLVAIAASDAGILKVTGPEFSIKFDYAGGSDIVYIGRAYPGSATSAPAWQIKRITYDGSANITDFKYAATSFTQIWDNRAALTYF